MQSAVESARPQTFRAPKKVLLVEDDPALKPIFDLLLSQISDAIGVEWVKTAEAALLRIKRPQENGQHLPYDLVIADIFLEGSRTGLDLLKRSRQMFHDLPFVLISGMLSEKYFATVGAESQCDFIQKPIDLNACQRLIENLLYPA